MLALRLPTPPEWMEKRNARTGNRTLAGRAIRSAVPVLLLLGAQADLAAAQGAGIAGAVRYYSNAAPVPNVAVQLTSVAGPMTAMTDPNGAYVFSDPGEGSCAIEPSKLGAFNGALSALDATWVLQYVVGLRSFDANQVLACDVTGDGTVSSLDATRILQLVAGLRNRLPVAESCGSDWVFVPVPAPAPNQHIIAPQTAPQCSAGAIVFDALSSPVEAQDFLALLFGDCTGNWQMPTPTATPPLPATATRTPTRTRTPSRTNTGTRTITPTRTGTRMLTPQSTFTPISTPTATCPNGLAWRISPPRLISAQSGGNLWLAKSVPTNAGWGIFWLRNDPGASAVARLYYAHVDFTGQITAGPLLVIGIPQINFRGHYYFAAWNQDHYGLLIANQSMLYYYNLSIDGALSGQRVVGPSLLASTQFDQESDGDLDAYAGGFIGVIEGDCGGGHSCSYAFKLDANGNPNGAVVNLVDFDFTHQFYPRAAFDGAGFAILSVKDLDISGGGVMTKYWPLTSTIGSHAKVVPAKPYLWDEFPDIAWNGDHFGAVWTENSSRSHAAPWQIHFATFRRTKPSSTLIAERVIDMVAQKTNHRWTTQLHAVGADWVAQYATRAADNSVLAVYELLGSDAQTRAALEPFALTADALGSSPHFVAGRVGTLGIARGSNNGAQGSEVSFYTLPPPACAQ